MTHESSPETVETRTVPEPLLRWTGALLNRSAQKVRDLFENRMSGSGLTSKHCSAIMLLDNGAKTPVELGRMLWVDRASMMTMLAELEESGNVQRENEAPNEQLRIELSEQGRETLARARQIADEVEAEIFSALSDEEREQLRGLLARLI